ncbi:MAG TPA: hypothetical protein VJ600_09380 [Holophagaceae bacterium]|nr:hypothetical protein [Holophagaceae bacterium]
MGEQGPSYIPILASIITGVVAFLGVVLTNRATYRRIKLENEINEKRKRLELHRDRGEELYVATDRWINMIGGKNLSILAVMQGKLSYNQYLDLAIKAGEKQNYDFARIEMIIDVYFPMTRPFYDRVIENRTEINKIDSEHHREYEKGNTDGHRFIQPYIDAQKKFEAAGEELKQQIKLCLRTV